MPRVITPTRLVALALFASLVLLAWYLRGQGLLDPRAVMALVDAQPALAIPAFLLVFTLSCVSMIPGLLLPLNLAAGLFWGPIPGTAIILFGDGIALGLCFVIARSLLGKPLARRFDNRYITFLQQGMAESGLRFMAFVRINPIFPTGMLNYLFALTAMRFPTCLWSSLVMLAAPTLTFAIIGHTVGDFLVDGVAGGLIRNALLVFLGIALLIFARYMVNTLYKGRRQVG